MLVLNSHYMVSDVKRNDNELMWRVCSTYNKNPYHYNLEDLPISSEYVVRLFKIENKQK